MGMSTIPTQSGSQCSPQLQLGARAEWRRNRTRTWANQRAIHVLPEREREREVTQARSIWFQIEWSVSRTRIDSMSIRLLAKYRYYFSTVMFSRCFASVYRSVCSNLSCLTPKRYHLLANPSFSSTPSISRTNLMREISSTMSLSLFLLYLFYQLFGNFLFIIGLIFAVLGSFETPRFFLHLSTFSRLFSRSLRFARRPSLPTEWARHVETDRSNAGPLPDALRNDSHRNERSRTLARISH